ncbi:MULTISPECIES: DUF6326 family protein [Dyella]|uniref:DUF6326 family protein n=1 Tax=Dyella TaxID=231454 RepID=UPI000C82DAF4|nr:MULTISPECIES: DUF6326 family protein [Dyella]MDR3443826.1 DUF6326 family protein [Dyella sp.]PMQ03074.1 hypothetical protein DyAD56_20340 [Dyella sp. AD56]ULU23626.1 hypothetical protein DYST_00524 [Dyella terrae]
MASPASGKTALEDWKVPVKLKLAALWASLMFCYIYGDYFGLFQPGTLQSMLEGKMGPLGPTTQGVLLGTSILMAVPSVMVFLSLVMRPLAGRVVNVVLGLLYAIIMAVSMPGAWTFYLFLGVIEIVLSLLIVWYAWRWPRSA